MADAFDARAALSIAVDLRQALNDIETFRERGGDIDDLFERVGVTSREAARFIEKTTGALKETGTAARAAKKDISVDDQSSEEWRALAKNVREAEEAYRAMSKTAAAAGEAPVNMPAFMAKQGISKADLEAYRQGQGANLVGDDARQTKEETRQRVAAEKAAADQIKRIDDTLARQQIANAQRRAKEEQRASDTLARQTIANAQRKAKEEQRAADAAARAWIATEQRIDKGIASGVAGANRGIASAGSYLDSQRNRSAGRIAQAPVQEWDKAFNTAVADADKKVRALAAAEMELANQASPRLRYALYDVSTTARTMALSLAAAGIAVGTLAAAQESAFTNVERTLDGADTLGADGVANLRKELMGLTREIPLTFSQISEIATLGNQLGISAGEVAGFTETTARFSAVTGLTVEASATAFGALGELLRNTDGTAIRTTQFENLGSAIAFVGRRSVATEAEIVSMSTRLAASATSAGFSAQEVIALSGAFASLRIAPERAQGVMEVYFNRLNTAISEGGPRLESFANVAGVATDQVEGLVRADPVKFFERLATGLGQLDSITRTSALEALGLQGIRAGEVFGRVSSNVDVFNQALSDSNKAWAENTEMSEQFAKVLDDLASRWQIFVNALAEAGGAIGTALAPNIIKVLGHLTNLLQILGDFAQSDFGATMFRIAGTAGMLIATLTGIATVAAVWGGSLFAMRLAAIELGIVTTATSGGIGGFIARLLGIRTAGIKAAGGMAAAGGAAAGAAGGMGAFAGATYTARNALVALGKATIVLGLISIAADGLFNLVGAASGANAVTGGIADGLSKAGVAAADLGPNLDDIDWDSATSGADDLGGAAGGAAEKVRTLADYAGDLSSVMKRSFDIRFGGEQGFDTILSGWQKIRDAADAAREAADAHQRKLAEMGADRNIKQYWLSVAENYGDELRAAKLRAELAELDANMADEQKKLADEQAKVNKNLVGNNQATADNRGEILGLVGNYQSYLQALAASGTSQKDLIAIAARLRGEFVDQATGLGYNRAEIEKYAVAFDDIGTIISRVPRNITVEFNGNPALLALNEFFDQAAAAAAAGGAGAGSAFGDGFDFGLGDGGGSRKMGDAVGRSIESAIVQSAPQADAAAILAGDNLGVNLVDNFDNRLAADMGEVDVIRSGWYNEQTTLADAAGGNFGMTTADSMKLQVYQGLKNYNPVGGWASTQSTNAYNSGAYLGSQVGGGIADGMRNALANKKIGANFTRGSGGIKLEGFRSGGYTGDMPTNAVAGVTHGKEFVFNAAATRAYGPNNLAYMQRMAQKGKAVAPAGIGAGGPGIVDISASSARLIADLLAANLQVVLPGSQLAGSVGAHNVARTKRGNA